MNPSGQGRWLRLGRGILIGYAVILIMVSLAGAILFPTYASQHAAEFTPNKSWTSAQTQAGLTQLGWPTTIPAYAELGQALLILIAGGGVALLLLWRQPASWFILYLAFTLASFISSPVFYKPLFTALPGLQAYIDFRAATWWQFTFVLFYFFPDGRPVPGWTRWPLLIWMGLMILYLILPAEAFFESSIVQLFITGIIFGALGSQVYRYFWRSTLLQRQQTKWIVAVVLLIVIEAALTASWLDNIPTGVDLRSDLVLALIKGGLDTILFAVVPVVIFIAILRYHLWDIDLVIRRTLLYAAVTVSLGLVYFGCILLLQQVFRVLSGQDSPIIVVISTLVIAALFMPLRRRFQAIIDRRFFRKKYDAVHALEEFSATARREVEIGRLTGQMVSVVQETVQPETISLWLERIGESMYQRYKLSAVTAWLLCAAVCLAAIISVGVLLVQYGQSENALKLAGGVVWILSTIPLAITAALIISRQPGNIIGWLLMEPALLLTVATPMDAYLKTILTPPAAPGFLFLVLIWFSNWDWLALIFPILLIALLFPDGRPPSARWRWVFILAAVFCAFFLIIATFAKKLGPVNADWTISNPIGFLDESQIQTIIGPWLAVMFLITVLCAASLVVRYRRANNGERKQIKWLMYAGCVFTVIYLQGNWISDTGSGDNFISNLYNLLLGLAILTFPASIAIAILRHHLWDIDLIIRRTIQYGLLTILLGLIYFGMVVMLEQAFRSFTGQESSLAVVLSTLAIASLFNPLRSRLQAGIDRRFYRQKYNAENAVSAFSTAVRSEVKVEVLSNLLADAARESFQPETVSLWLKKN